MSTIKLLRAYQNALQNKPYLVQSVQTASLMTVGDIISQSIIEQKSHKQINYLRIVKFGSIGFILGPVLTKWYRMLDKVVSSSVKIAILKKVALDQFVFAPFVIAGLTTTLCVFEGQNIQEINNKLKADYLSILFSNYKVWPIVQFVNFSFVPLDYRVLVTQSVAVAWNTYLSWKLNSNPSTT